MMTQTTRDSVIVGHVQAAMRHTRLSWEALADAVLALYHERTADTQRNVRFHAISHADPYTAMRANGQLLRRMIEGAVRMPVEIEESIVLSLPEPYRSACTRDLMRRYGFMAAPLPAAQGTGQRAQMGDLVRHCGDVLATLSPMFDDGTIDPADAEHAPAALAALDDLAASIATLTAMIRAHSIPPGAVSSIKRGVA